MIDARDLSEWIVKMIEGGESGIFNVTGKPFEMNFGQMLDAIKTATGAEAEFVWADEKFLTENNVQPWNEMPFYLPESFSEARGFLAMNIDKALAKDLKFRTFAETVRDVLDWREKRDFEMKAGISAEREAELLEKLRKRQ
jgi:2'-hydroxyisoflavone reductase